MKTFESHVAADEPNDALEAPKLSIKFDNKFKSITAFEWNDIPNFAVITGINGTGKSQLLQLIHANIIDNGILPQVRLAIKGKEIKRHEVTFLAGEWQLEETNRISLAT